MYVIVAQLEELMQIHGPFESEEKAMNFANTWMMPGFQDWNLMVKQLFSPFPLPPKPSMYRN